MVNNTVVIGIGNSLRGDDGAGWAVVETLSEESVAGVTAVCTHQLLPEHIDLFRCASQVIFVDASVVGKPGEIILEHIEPTMDGPAASHHLHPGVLLALGHKLYGRMPPAYLLTITGLDFGYRESLSEPIEEAVGTAVCRIRQLINAPSFFLKQPLCQDNANHP